MNEGGSRRAVAEIRFGEDRIGITKVGGRSIHQYWTLLGPHFRDVLLAPHPKKPGLFSLHSSIRVKGPIRKPKFSLEKDREKVNGER